MRPVVIYVNADTWSYYSSGIFQCGTTNSINHAVLLVGYDSVAKYWIIQNSWGTW